MTLIEAIKQSQPEATDFGPKRERLLTVKIVCRWNERKAEFMRQRNVVQQLLEHTQSAVTIEILDIHGI